MTGKFDPKIAGDDLLRVVARAGDTPDFSALARKGEKYRSE